MIEEKLLIDLGLSEVEAKTYLACLEMGSDSVLRIAKKAAIKRPTAYIALDSLAERGFVSKIEKGTTTHYAAEDPSVILNAYKQKLANLNDLIPFFRARFNKGPKPKIRFYEGREALLEIYTTRIFPAEVIYFFGADFNVLNQHIPGLIAAWSRFNLAKKKDYREIIAPSEDGIAFAKKNKLEPNFRLMPPDLPVKSDSAITEDAVFIVSPENQVGVLIESSDIAESYRNFFLMAWAGAAEIT